MTVVSGSTPSRARSFDDLALTPAPTTKVVDGTTEGALCIPINTEFDIVDACRAAYRIGTRVGFDSIDITRIATAISELARNILRYAGHGEISLSTAVQTGRRGITVVASDKGPGIADINLAMRDGYSTGGTLGLGLAGAKRLMDDFDLVSTVGRGTVVTATKWAQH